LLAVTLLCVLVAGSLGLGAPAGAQAASGPLTLQEVVTLVKRGLTEGRLRTLVLGRCVTFEPSDPAVGDALRAAGASPAFLQALTATCGRAARERAARERAAAERASADRAAAERGTAEPAAPPRPSASRGTLAGPHGIRFVRVRAGTFAMGAETRLTDERPVHRVTLTRDYLLQTTEVTQGQWRAVMGTNPSYHQDCGDTCPAEQVSYDDVQAFLRELNRRDPGKGYRLPTEAEWEYAARAGTTEVFWGAGQLDAMGWYRDNSEGRPHPVGQKAPNAWGLYDLHGNVWEWVQDWYGAYEVAPQTNPTGPASGSSRVLRGGSWNDAGNVVRSSYRDSYAASHRNSILGFRLARTP
jgi:formylglycine-generating enzyme required for sulfatase activity